MRDFCCIILYLSCTIGLNAQPVTEYYDNGEIKQTGTLADGKKTGKWEFFYPSGVIEAIEYYQNDQLNGLATSFDFDGNKITVENWVAGNLEDSAFYYYANGTLEKKGVYNAGLYEGIWIFFYPTGMLKKKLDYKNGLPNGQWQYYAENGNLLQEGEFVDGKEEGEWDFYSNKGWLLYQGKYEKGKRVGVWYIFKKSGKKKPVDYSEWEF